MKLGRAANLLILMGVLGAVGARPALAAERACSPMVVEADDDVLGRWPQLPDRVRGAFERRGDIDACARVRLTLSDAAIIVAVILPDGRSASRSVSRREDVVPVLEALLLVPRRPSPPPSESEPSPSPPASSLRAVPAAVSLATSERDATKPSREAPPRSFGIELSVATGARIGDGQTSVGVGAMSFLDVAGWLVGFAGRADQYGLAGGPEGGALELAALGGRRFWFRTVALDLIGGPAVAVQGNSFSRSGPDGSREEHTSGSEPRLLFGARLNLAARSVLRTFVGIDGEVGVVSASDANPPIDVHRLPDWTLGLAVGATVGTP